MSVFSWILGRGVAEALGLSWTVPEADYAAFRQRLITRGELVAGIRDSLSRAQARARFDFARARRFARLLPRGRHHHLVTTNWNTLLDRALEQEGLRVWHLNGSLDDPPERLLTELDRRSDGFAPPLEDLAPYRLLRASDACVVAGLSAASMLDCQMLAQLARDRRCAIRQWFVVNPATPAPVVLPRATLIQAPFERWVDAGMPGLA